MGDALKVQDPDEFSPEESRWLCHLPDELSKQLTEDDAKMLVRVDPSQWPPELVEKVRPYIDRTST